MTEQNESENDYIEGSLCKNNKDFCFKDIKCDEYCFLTYSGPSRGIMLGYACLGTTKKPLIVHKKTFDKNTDEEVITTLCIPQNTRVRFETDCKDNARAERALVLRQESKKIVTESKSKFCPTFIYKTDNIINADSFSENLQEFDHGIHFCFTKEEAENSFK